MMPAAYKYKELTEKIIGLAIKVHQNLGPGLPEKIYQRALYLELQRSGLEFEREKRIDIKYGRVIVGFQILDFTVEGKVIVELKSTDYIGDVHLGQMLTYLKASKLEIGLLLNFAKTKLEIKRVVYTP